MCMNVLLVVFKYVGLAVMFTVGLGNLIRGNVATTIYVVCPYVHV